MENIETSHRSVWSISSLHKNHPDTDESSSAAEGQNSSPKPFVLPEEDQKQDEGPKNHTKNASTLTF